MQNISKLYKSPRHQKAGMSFTMCKYMLDDLLDDIEFYGIETTNPQEIINICNEMCIEHGQKYNAIEAEIIIEEMANDMRFRVYFANIGLTLAQRE